MALSLLLEEMRPGDQGEAQNENVGVTVPLQATVPPQANTKTPLCLTPSPMGKTSLKTEQTWLISFQVYSNLFWPHNMRPSLFEHTVALLPAAVGWVFCMGSQTGRPEKAREGFHPKTAWSLTYINLFFLTSFSILLLILLRKDWWHFLS